MEETELKRLYDLSMTTRKTDWGDEVAFFDYRKFAELVEDTFRDKIEELNRTNERLFYKNKKLKEYITDMIETGREALEPER